MTITCDECEGRGAIIVDKSLGITEQCPVCKGNGEVFMNAIKPYSDEEYEEAKKQGLDLGDWDDYVKFFGLGEEVEYD